MTSTAPRRRRSDGERSHRAILLTAARLATVEGLDGLTIGRLAAETGMSKSGLFAHFGSKERLQLATIEAAQEIFDADVLAPALEVDGLARAEALSERFLSHLERRVFPGGCFFASAAAEMDRRPGPVRDRVAQTLDEWSGLFVEAFGVARERGEIAADEDPAQLTFEVTAMLAHGNGVFLLSDDPAALEMARAVIARRLDRARAAGAAKT